jgi:hypothetical protein
MAPFKAFEACNGGGDSTQIHAIMDFVTYSARHIGRGDAPCCDTQWATVTSAGCGGRLCCKVLPASVLSSHYVSCFHIINIYPSAVPSVICTHLAYPTTHAPIANSDNCNYRQLGGAGHLQVCPP